MENLEGEEMKEFVISIVIIILIFVGNFVTENYTKQSVEQATKILGDIRDEIMKEDEEVNFDFVDKKIDEMHEEWDKRYEKLAYYIEHNELEKVETDFTGLRAYIDKQEYTEVLAELDKSVYILEHIKQKSMFNLKNIF